MSVKQTVKHLLLPAPAVRRVPLGLAKGVRLKIDFARQTQLYLGLYEVELAAHVRRLCKPGSRVLELGTNDASTTLVMALLAGTSGSVVTVEGNEDFKPVIDMNLAANPALAERIEVLFRMIEPEGLNLDEYATTNNYWPTFVYMDIEGAEAVALRCSECILARRPDLIIETHGKDVEAECVDLLGVAGYSPVVVDRRRWLPEARLLDHNRWLIAEAK